MRTEEKGKLGGTAADRGSKALKSEKEEGTIEEGNGTTQNNVEQNAEKGKEDEVSNFLAFMSPDDKIVWIACALEVIR